MGMCYCKMVQKESSNMKEIGTGTGEELMDKLKVIDEKEVNYFSFSGKRIRGRPCNVYDGDTFSLMFVFGDDVIKYRCRCLGYDTPEMKPSLKNPNREKEKEMAKKAKERFMELLGRGGDGFVEVVCGGFDKYGRILVTVYNGVDEKSLNEIMIEEGHGIPYNGGTKESFVPVVLEEDVDAI